MVEKSVVERICDNALRRGRLSGRYRFYEFTFGKFHDFAARQAQGGSSARRDDNAIFYCAVALVFPLAFDCAEIGFVLCADASQPLVRLRCEREMPPAAVHGVRFDACRMFEEPADHRAVCIVVERVHAHVAETSFFRVTIPTLPNRRRTLIDGIEPRRELPLKKKRVRKFGFADLGQHLANKRRSEESSRKPVAVGMDGVDKGAGNLLAVAKSELQCEERRSLHPVEEVAKRPVLPEPCRKYPLLRLPRKVRIVHPLRKRKRGGKFGHLQRIAVEVAGVQEVLVGKMFFCVAAVRPALRLIDGKLFERKPVAEKPVAALRYVAVLGDASHVALHDIPILTNHIRIAQLTPKRPRDDYRRVAPSRYRTVVAECTNRHYIRDDAVGVLRVADVLHPLRKESANVRKIATRLCEHLRIARPTETFRALWAVGRDGEIIGKHRPVGVLDEAVYALVARFDLAALHFLGDRRDWHGRYGAQQRLVGGDRSVAVAVESMQRMVVLHSAVRTRTALADILERGARAAHVCEIYAALRPVAVMTRHAVVQHFAKSHSHSRARLGGKLHVGNRRAVLSEINYVRFARLDLEAERHRLAVLKTVTQD